MRKNYKILKILKNMALGLISEQTLLSHGFDFDAVHKAEIVIDENGKKIQAYHVYDIYFQITDNGILIL